MGRLLRRYLKSFAMPIVMVCLLTPLEVYASLMLPDLMGSIINTGVVARDMSYVMREGLAMLGWSMVAMAAALGVYYFGIRVSMGFGRDVRAAVFKHAQSFPPRQFDSFGTSSLLTRTTNDVSQLERFVSSVLGNGVMAPFMFVGAVVLSMRKSVQLSLVLLGAVLLATIFMCWVVHAGLPLMRMLQKRIDRLNLVTRENLSGMRVIRAYNRQDRVEKRFDEAAEGLSQSNIDVVRTMGMLIPGIIMLLNLAIVAIIWLGGIEVEGGGLLVGDLMAIIEYAAYISTSIMLLSLMFSSLPRAVAGAERISEVLEMQPEVVDAKGAAAAGMQERMHAGEAPATGGGEKPETGGGEKPETGSIEFDDVTFRYPGADKPALEHVSISIPAGQAVAVIGSTGSGKSTLLALMLRFCDPTEGSVRLDGQDVRELSIDALRRRLSYAPQHARLFSGTVGENIRKGLAGTCDVEGAGGRGDARSAGAGGSASDARLVHAAQTACADGFISEMEGGYTAAVSQGGASLSGGQRQRIALARAIVRDAEAYLLDDPFSALDLETDLAVRTALKRELAGKTVVMVAQRISVARDADAIIVMDEGRVAGVGTHDELIGTCEVYRQIAASQTDSLFKEAG